MAHTINEYSYNGTETDYDLSFSGGFRVRSDVSAYKRGPNKIPISFSWLTNARVRISTAGLVQGDVIVFVRTVSKVTAPVNLLLPNNFTREAVVTAVNHTLMALQEVLDGRTDEFTGLFIDKMTALLNETTLARDDAALSMQQAVSSAEQAALSEVAAVQGAAIATNAAVLAALLLDSGEPTANGQSFATPYPSYGATVNAVQSAEFPLAVLRVSCSDSVLVEWVRKPGGPCLGGGWIPVGDALPDHFGAIADWNGTTGTDNTSALRDWLSYGKQCRGRSGRYRVTGTLEFTASNETVDGRGMEIVHDTPDITNVLTITGLTNSKVTGFVINGRKSLKSGEGVQAALGIASYACEGLTIKGNYVFDCLEHGIRTGDISGDIHILNNVVKNCGSPITQRGAGIWMFGGHDRAVVSGNILSGNEWGLGFDDSSSPPRSGIVSRKVTITGNVVTGSNPLEAAFRFEGSHQGVITGNVGIGYGMGVQCRKIQSDRLSEQVSITGNTLDATRCCVSLSSSMGVSVSGNSLRMSVADTSIVRCAVEVYSQTIPRAERIIVTGNSIETAQHGVLIGVSPDHNQTQFTVVVLGNVIFYLSAVPATSFYGVHVSARRAAIRDNEIYGGFTSGVYASNYGSGDITIRGNEVTGCVSHALHLSPGNVATTSVMGNRTWGNGGGGLRLESSANRIETSIAYNHFAEGFNGSTSSCKLTSNVT